MSEIKSLEGFAFVDEGARAALETKVDKEVYELIVSETINTGLKIYECSGLNLRCAFVKLHAPAYAEATNTSLNAQYVLNNDGATTASVVSQVADAIRVDYESYSVFGEAYINKGYWTIGMGGSSSLKSSSLIGSNKLNDFKNTCAYSSSEYPSITKILIHNGPVGYIPAGSTIEIWGVRASE